MKSIKMRNLVNFSPNLSAKGALTENERKSNKVKYLRMINKMSEARSAHENKKSVWQNLAGLKYVKDLTKK